MEVGRGFRLERDDEREGGFCDGFFQERVS